LSRPPFLLRRLRELSAVNAAGVDALARDGILTLADLELALLEGRPSASNPAIRRAADALAHERGPLTLGRAADVLEGFLPGIAQIGVLDDIEPAGDVRRFEPTPRDLIVVARSADPPGALDAIAGLSTVSDVLHRTARRVILVFQGHEIDVRVATRDEYGSVLFTTTGPPSHVVELQRRRGPRLGSTETELYAQAGMSFLPPEVRGTPGSLEAAIHGGFPRLVSRQDIRGDLHMHTSYSDGADPLRDMVAASCRLGYEYIAITDHSEHAAASRTLTRDLLLRQRDEIGRVREQFPQIAILHGIEADILADGRIDCADDVLSSLDIVLASLHERHGHDGRRLTERCLSAIHHPLVSVITHPQNQLVGRRPGYDMEYAAIYEAAVETGTVLEIDGAPAHLDLDSEHAREAVAAGVTVSIDSDCHRARWLDRQMRFGVGIARRGWVEPRHVLNTRSLSEVRAFLARKRRRVSGL
jgi:DNA polymerase (family 10)